MVAQLHGKMVTHTMRSKQMRTINGAKQKYWILDERQRRKLDGWAPDGARHEQIGSKRVHNRRELDK